MGGGNLESTLRADVKRYIQALWSPDIHSSAHDQQHNYQFLFLNRLFLLYLLIAVSVGLFRWNAPHNIVTINILSAISAILLFVFLRRNPHKVELVANVTIVFAFVASYGIYLLAYENSARLTLMFPFIATVFFLKGFRTTLQWTLVVIVTWQLALLWPGAEGVFSQTELAIAGVYLTLLFFILWNYEIIQNEQSLRQREYALQKMLDQRWRVALEGAGDAIWDWDINADRFITSKSYADMLGYTEEEIGLTSAHLERLLHPDDRAESVALLDEYLNGDFSGQYRAEHRFLCKDGSYKWILCRARVTQSDIAGRPQRMVGTHVDITERKEHEKNLHRIAHYDVLTGVPNRVLLADRLLQALARAKRDHGLMAVCYLDLDGFKPVNDNFGHEAGDKILVEITRRIKEAIREDDTVARLGGDEFVVLLVGMQVPEECAGSLNRLLEVINLPIEMQGQSIRISASIGVALYPEDDHDPDTLLRHADQAMYVAKQSGKNRYHLFDSANDQRARSHHELQQQLRHGLVQGEFELYYQPKVELDSRRMVGAEALIRWNHPTRGLLSPGEFLRIIEDTEMEIELGDWVIATAIEQQRRWREQGLQIEVSINVSAYHLQSPGFSEKLKKAAYQCDPGDCAGTLQIEVLETAALEDVAGVSTIIAECKAFGMTFALDDFGTGYSSMSYLSKFDVDVLKIDQSFIHDMLQDKGDHAIVQGIIALAKAFEMGIVAEGVETKSQYQALLLMGCELGQGYGIARPMTADALLEWR